MCCNACAFCVFSAVVCDKVTLCRAIAYMPLDCYGRQRFAWEAAARILVDGAAVCFEADDDVLLPIAAPFEEPPSFSVFVIVVDDLGDLFIDWLWRWFQPEKVLPPLSVASAVAFLSANECCLFSSLARRARDSC